MKEISFTNLKDVPVSPQLVGLKMYNPNEVMMPYGNPLLPKPDSYAQYFSFPVVPQPQQLTTPVYTSPMPQTTTEYYGDSFPSEPYQGERQDERSLPM